MLTLTYTEAGGLATGDEPPVVLGGIGDALAAAGLAFVSPPAWVPATLLAGSSGGSSGAGNGAGDGAMSIDGGPASAAAVRVSQQQQQEGLVAQHPVLPAVGGGGAPLQLRPGRLLRFTLREVRARRGAWDLALTPW